jgi:isoleucyl-tRNA synthetase
MYDHKVTEEKLIAFWKKNKTFEKSVSSRPTNKQFVFYDGPPFATGLPHYGNILGLTAKDIFPRYWTMKGYKVERKWGWDCHGLPIETIAEKALNIKTKKEIEEMGVAKFNEACRSKVLYYVKEWKKTVDRMGKWIEFDNAYKTMDVSYMESVWHIFKKLYNDGYIYEGKKVLLYCSRCETPLASSEIAMDNSYQDITEKAVTSKFKLKNEKDSYVLAWTTTPWTLIGNTALAINKELMYVKIKVGKEYYILAKDRLETIKEEYKVMETFKGNVLIDKEYEPLYHIKTDKKGHYIINGGNEVSAEEGTGVVHMALYGEFDYKMIKKYNLPFIQHINKSGKVHLGPDEFKQLWFKDADKKVLEDLEQRNLIISAENYTHSYPFCYRCDTPLFYNALDSWFIDIQKVKDRLLAKNKDINWYPENIKEGRFKHILETAPDWTISRNRFWATAIPVWKCDKGNHLTVVGSIKELQEKAVEKVKDNIDLHKHIIDKIHLKCTECKGKMTRIPEVLDCWVESGSMPYAAKHYPFENKTWFKNNFPADFISEYTPQVRTWFYYMHVLSVILFDKPPFRNVVVSGNLLAADGTKMSKSKLNYPDPQEIFDAYGADTLRFYLMNSPLMRAEDINFKEENVKEVYRKVTMLLYNVHQFYQMYGKTNKVFNKPSTQHILDKWIISKLHHLIRNTTNYLDEYNTINTCNEITTFIHDLSLWYIRRSRDRFSKKEKQATVQTLGHILITLAKIVSPIMPFIADEMYQQFKQANKKLLESIHLETWPTHDESLISETIEKNMDQTRQIVSMALEERSKAGIPIRQPLNILTIQGVNLTKEYTQLIADEINVKKVETKKGTTTKVTLDTKLTPALEQEGYMREITRRIQALRKKAGLKKEDTISLWIESTYNLKKFEQDIKNKVGAKKITFGKAPKEKSYEKIKIKDQEFKIACKKV